MENNVHESTQESNSDSQQGFDLGTIVATQAHPYLPGEDFPKIGSYNHLTPPFMIIVEAHHSGKYDTATGEKLSGSFKCLYYSTSTGKFEDNWFKKEELKLVERFPESLARKCQDRSFSQLKRKTEGENGGIIGLQVILNTVDWELDKTMVYKDSNPTSTVYKEKAILDFLPPLGTIKGVSRVQDNTQYSEKTGRQLVDKGKLLAKVRYYNNKTSKFSEQEIPLSALKEVVPLGNVNYDKDKVYLYQKETKLEDSEIKLKAVPVKFCDIIFNHYKYEFRFQNIFNHELLTTCEQVPELKSSNIRNLLHGIKGPEPKRDGADFKTDNWYKIQYIDRRLRYTKRIIRVCNITKDGSSGERKSSFIEANCLLRNGEIRNFYVDRILRFEKTPKEFVAEFVKDEDGQ